MESSYDYGLWMMVAFNVLLFRAIIAFGSILLSKGGELIKESNGKLVTDGSYSSIRYSQYIRRFLISIGMLIQWSTLPTLIKKDYLL
jgi:protein-S-isoprenylcysteine O-methyltransferase Ste14